MKKKYFLGAINTSILFLLIVILSIGLLQIGIYSNAKTILLILVLITSLLLSIALYLNTKTKSYNIGTFLTFLLNVILLFNIYDLNNNYSYIGNLRNSKYEYKTYELYVKKTNTKYNDISKLENKKIGILENNKDNVESFISNKVNSSYVYYDNLDELLDGISSGEVQAIVIKEELIEEEKTILNKYRMIYSNKIKVKI